MEMDYLMNGTNLKIKETANGMLLKNIQTLIITEFGIVKIIYMMQALIH